MTLPKQTLTDAQMQAEWQEVQAAQQQPAQFRVLYNRYYDPIFRFIYQRLLDQELTADLCSQVFLKAMQNLHKYTYQGVPFSAWLYRIATNEISQHYRQTNRSRVVALEDFHAKDLEHEFDNKEDLEVNIQQLKVVIQQLDPDEVELLELRFFEKRPFKEVADILEMTENNAKVKIYRLMQKMRKLFEAKAKK